jgi:choline-glycine betaine transporter
MSRVDDDSMLGPMVRTMQIIIVALTLGLVVFLGIVLFLREQPKPAPPQPAAKPAQALPVISYAALAFAVMAVPMSLLIPSVVVKNGRKQIARGTWTPPVQGTGTFPQGPFGNTVRLAAVYQTSLIVGAALNEGPAFFALIAYLLERLPAILGVAVLLILGVAARFPTRARVEQWIDAQKELLIQEQQAGG